MNLNLPALPVSMSLNRPGLAAELRAFGAVARRNWIIFLRYPSWIVAMFIWPVIFPAAYVFTGLALAGPDGSGLKIFQSFSGTEDFLGYIAVGTTIWMWQNIVLWDVGYVLRNDQLRGTLETNWMSPTWRFSFLLGGSVTQLVTSLLFLTVSAFEFVVFFGVRFHGSPGLVLLVLLAAIPSIYGIGMTFASLVISVKEANAFVFLVRGLVMVFCGITFPVTLLPGWMQSVAAWLPPTYIIRAMRNELLVGAGFDALLPDLLAILGLGLVWLVIGFVTFNWMERRARQTGSIGHY